jgi:prepilin-type N-terminal cleavage/methylation domain-containing protein
MKRSGYTLIELIVSIAIIAMITAIFLVNYHSTTRRADLRLTAQRVVSDIRLTQNYALGLMSYGAVDNRVAPAGGWGIVFDSDSSEYSTFADITPNHLFDIGEAEADYGAIIHTLPANFIIEDIKVKQISGLIISVPKVNIIFLPPDPKVFINALESNQEVELVLKDQTTEETKNIKINFLGLAEVLGEQ